MARQLGALTSLLFLPILIQAIQLDINDPVSIKSAARQITNGIFALYSGNAPTTTPENIGLWPKPPYYWWQSGATWAGLIDYVHYTSDTSLVPLITQALLAQKGPANNFIMPAKRNEEGNDDQAFWGLGVMSALENRFPEPPAPNPSWLATLEALFADQMARWDMSSCGGGLKWQIYPENDYGYDYKNAVSNGAYFQLAARLFRFTGKPIYLQEAQKVWNWCQDIGLISPSFEIFDGTDDKLNCTEMNHIQWTYNNAIFLHGCAALWSATRNNTWEDRMWSLIDAANVFFTPFANSTNVMFEAACETAGTCNVDQFSFKAYMSRWMGKTMVLAPQTHLNLMPYIEASATAAAEACTGPPGPTEPRGAVGSTCGHKWFVGGWDGTQGLGQQQSALETIQALLALDAPEPFSLLPGVMGRAGGSAVSPMKRGEKEAKHDGTHTFQQSGGEKTATSSCLAMLLALVAAVLFAAGLV